MDIFGERLVNHMKKNKTKAGYKEINYDLVVLPGDFSWAMHLEDTDMDFEVFKQHARKKTNAKRKPLLLVGTLSQNEKILTKKRTIHIDFG